MENERATWLVSDKIDEQMKKELESASELELVDLFYRSLPFGTGGMRGIIGPGTNRINAVTVAKASRGYGGYLLKKWGNVGEVSVVIGYDNRHYSRSFAQHTAEVLGGLGIKTYLFSIITATPLVSFAIQYLKAHGGIVITASHNPPEYNGFKVYDETGCQLLPTTIEHVVNEIEKITDIHTYELSNKFINIINKEILLAYRDALAQKLFPKKEEKCVTIGFSPQHGTALKPIQKLYEYYGYHAVTYVKEQLVEDPDFNGTQSANPEDNIAFEKLIEYGQREKLDILLTTDPDADRLGVAYKDKNNKYNYLNGNQVGALLIDYLIQQKTPKELEHTYVVKTIVTSELGATIARKNNIKVLNVLTGFKYIGDAINNYGADNFLCGYEESYGYLVYPITRDKDGIQIAIILTEIANYYKLQGKTLGDRLEELYQTYGYYKEELLSFAYEGRDGTSKINETYQQFLELDWEDIVYFENYENSSRLNFKTGEAEILSFEKSKVLKFILEDSSWFCVRPSGTEPKIKLYFGTNAMTSKQAEQNIQKMKKRVENYLYST